MGGSSFAPGGLRPPREAKKYETKVSDNRYTWRADKKHREILIDEWGLVSANRAETPAGEDGRENREAHALLGPEEARRFRRAVARLNYMSLDRPDLATAANLLSRWMAAPRQGDEKLLKRVRDPRLVFWFDGVVMC